MNNVANVISGLSNANVALYLPGVGCKHSCITVPVFTRTSRGWQSYLEFAASDMSKKACVPTRDDEGSGSRNSCFVWTRPDACFCLRPCEAVRVNGT